VVATPVQRYVEREGQKPHGADSLPGSLLLQAWAKVFASVAQHEDPDALNQCALLGVKRTSVAPSPMSAFDPKRTFAAKFCWDTQRGSEVTQLLWQTTLYRVRACAIGNATRCIRPIALSIGPLGASSIHQHW
jgi:hypothetical protein